ncbi:MAG TPA: YHS domain-containing (seleno)protein [Xanthobacteraceae bacterium]|nr:YHS domain-containing (seleno)protein [Xanthobacteraceae bacterium]
MTAARQQRKSGALAVLAAIGLFWLAGPAPPAGWASTTERIVVDPNRGLALAGFDPVAYFTEGKPVMGVEQFEYEFAGAVWRFQNQGNRAAFAANPDVYTPVFGGHDPVGVARGVARAGHPEIWTIYNEHLYLFYSAEARQTFVSEAERTAAAAERMWPTVMRTLSP